MRSDLRSDRSPSLLASGRTLFGLSLVAFGGLYLLRGRLVSGLPPLPGWLPGGAVLAYVTGTLLLAGGVLLVARVRVPLVASALGWLLLAASCLYLTHAHDVMMNGGIRTGFLEALTLAGAAWVLAGSARLRDRGLDRTASRDRPPLPLPTLGRYLVAATLVAFGLQHFEYLTFVALLVPPWLHVPRFWVVFTGAAMIAAGLAVALRILDRLAGLLLAAMFFGWILVLHGPRIAHQPRNADEWTSGFVALAFAATGLLLAATARTSRQLDAGL